MIDPGLQIVLSVGMPTLAVLVGVLLNNSRLSDLRSHMDSKFDTHREVMEARFREVDTRFEQFNERLDHLDRTFDAKPRRVEEVLDARLKHIEEEIERR
ncbi:MAG: hypothetical protein SFV18_16675 [Bryobacteraceae bacterium]|nr:hypothetical protein [Bryobacteraceae bacterium]